MHLLDLMLNYDDIVCEIGLKLDSRQTSLNPALQSPSLFHSPRLARSEHEARCFSRTSNLVSECYILYEQPLLFGLDQSSLRHALFVYNEIILNSPT